MSISDRLMDAKTLYDAGRYEGALLCVLVAAAGSSRKRFPRSNGTAVGMGDREAFERFMREEMAKPGACSVLFGGQCVSSEHIFYKWMRCSLTHEAQLPEQILFVAGESNGEASIERQPGPPEKLIITHSIVLFIAHLVSSAPENSDIPASVRTSLIPS